MADVVRTPYTDVAKMTVAPTWINTYDRERYAAYSVYDAMFHNEDGTYALVSRGAENKPVYMPTAKTIIKTINRYTAVNPTLAFTGPSDAANANAKLLFDTLFRRERFWSKFASNKLQGIRRGDWIWHIVANPLKAEGQRISIYAVDPRQYFKLTAPTDVDRTVGCDIVEQIVEGDKTLIKRQRYTKGPDPLNGGIDDGKIWSSVTIWEIEQWEDPTKAPFRIDTPPFALPDAITQLPVYHIPHNEETGNPYGYSELSGFERVLSAITQSTSDEELALALEGLGMYSTDAGPPRDPETGREVPWRLGPGRVVERPTGTSFDRVDGIGSLAPYQEHLKWLMDYGIKEPIGITDAAIGKIDAQVAESGVALAIQLSPTLSETARNDVTIKEIHDQMIYDLKAFLAAYEGQTIDEGVIVEMVFGDKLPVNRKQQVEELFALFDKGIIDSVYLRLQMEKFGYVFPEGMAMAVATERAQMMAAVADPEVAGTASRDAAELSTPDPAEAPPGG